MFDDTLNSSWDDRSRHGLTTLTSFGLQALAVGVLLVHATSAAGGAASVSPTLDACQFGPASGRASHRQSAHRCKHGRAQ